MVRCEQAGNWEQATGRGVGVEEGSLDSEWGICPTGQGKGWRYKLVTVE